MDFPDWTRAQNLKAARFWANEARELDRRTAVDGFRAVAMRRLAAPDVTNMRPSLEWLLAEAELDAALLAPEVRKRAAAHAASQRGPDALQELIVDLVRQCPTMTCPELLIALRDREGGDVVEFVSDGNIDFKQPRGKGVSARDAKDVFARSAKISGLKDRLRRAKATIRRIG